MRWISRFVQRWSSKPAPPPPTPVKPLKRYEFPDDDFPKYTYPRACSLDGFGIVSSTAIDQPPPPEHYLLKHPDGRITTKDGEPASFLKSSDMLPPALQVSERLLNPKPRWDKDGNFIGWST